MLENNQSNPNKRTLYITIAMMMVLAIIASTFLNIDIQSGKAQPNQYQKALHIGIGNTGLSITIGMADQAYADVTFDYTCDGTADNEQFQQALDDLPNGGGEIVVFGGTYDLDANVTRAIDNVVWRGVGYSSYVTRDGSNPCITIGGNRWSFDNIRFDAGFVSTGATTGWQFTRCWDGATLYDYYDDSMRIVNGDIESITLSTGSGSPVAKGVNHLPVIYVAAANSSTEARNAAWATCDGTDDNVEIQAAMNELAATGGELKLSEGTFYISATLDLVDNIYLHGTVGGQKNEGATRLIPTTNLANGVIRGNGASGMSHGLHLGDFGIDGDRNYTGIGINLINYTNSRIDNIWVDGIQGEGLRLYNCWDIDFYGCQFNNNGLAATTTPQVLLYGPNSGSRTDSCHFESCTFHDNYYNNVMLEEYCTNNIFSNCKFHGFLVASGTQYPLFYESGTHCNKNVIHHSEFHAGTYGIQVSSDRYVIDHNFMGAEIDCGISMGGDFSTIDHNIIFGDSTADGIEGSGSNDVIQGNVIRGKSRGIDWTGWYAEILDNDITLCQNQGINSNSRYALISNNRVYDCSRVGVGNADGIYSAQSYQTVTENSVYGANHGFDIKLTGASSICKDNSVQTDISFTGTSGHLGGNIGWITFNSGTSTGTGGQQTIAHGLDVTPVKADVTLTMLASGTYSAFVSADPDATNIYVQAPVGIPYAWRVDTED